MTVGLPVTPLGPTLRLAGERIKDKTYQRCPIGQEVRRYLSDCEWAGLTENTRLGYETVLARLAVDHDDIHDLEFFCSPVGAEYLHEFVRRHWADSAQATKAQRVKIVRGFFKWAAATSRIPYDPSATLKPGRGRGRKVRQAYPPTVIAKLLHQPRFRDEVVLELVYRLGLRREDIRMLQVRDIDLVRNVVRLLHGKGGHEDVLPLEYPKLRERLYLHIVAGGLHPAEYLLYARDRRHEPMSPAGVHNWFKRCLEHAGLPTAIKLHELRHTALDEMHRATGDIVKAQKLARHKSPGTTADYLHPLEDDLRAGMRAVEVFSSRDPETTV